jgi:hypothetical protein
MRTTEGQADSATMFKRSELAYIWSKLFILGTVGRVVAMCVECTYSGVQTLTNRFYMNYFNLRIILAKLSRGAKQHPSNSAHLMRRSVRGLSMHVYKFFIYTDFQA